MVDVHGNPEDGDEQGWTDPTTWDRETLLCEFFSMVENHAKQLARLRRDRDKWRDAALSLEEMRSHSTNAPESGNGVTSAGTR